MGSADRSQSYKVKTLYGEFVWWGVTRHELWCWLELNVGVGVGGKDKGDD
jgi:hypothetical protein